MVRSCKTPAFWSKSDPTRRRFEVFQSTLESVHGLVLEKPDFSSSGVSSFKDFCSAILERRKHMWDIALRRSRDLRFSVGMSLFLFRKIIPSSRPDPAELLRKLSVESPEPDSQFMDFVRNQVPKLFPVGWDSQYPQQCLNSVVPTKSYAEKRKCEDGCSRSWFLSRWNSDEEARSSFIEVVLASIKPVLRDDVASRIQVVPSSGKYRALSIPQVRMNYLRPLHKTMYDYMSRYKWLLRGDAKVARFKDFCAVEGEELVSGDYESATDNLNLNVQKEILRLVLQNARHVPPGIIVSAMRSCSPKLTLSEDAEDQAAHVELRSGQMMGNLLSFPLLCLVNYLTFKYLVPRQGVPVKINGDDIVFRCRQDETRTWMQGVQVSGLTLSRGKTIVDGRYFTINSTMFKGSSRRVRPIPFLRAKSLFGKGEEDVIESLAGRCRAFYTSYSGKAKSILRTVFFKQNSGHIKKSCRSITQGLSIKAQPKEIIDAGLWSRELRYLSAGDEKPLPVSKSWWSNNPEGWHLRWVSLKEKKKREKCQELSARFVEAAWKSPSVHAMTSVKDEARSTGLDMSDSRVLRTKRWTEKMTSLIRMPYRWIKTRFSSCDPRAWDKRPIKSRFACWFKDDESSFAGYVEGDKLAECREAFGWIGDARLEVNYPISVTLLPRSFEKFDEVVENSEEIPSTKYTYCFKPPTSLTDGKYISTE